MYSRGLLRACSLGILLNGNYLVYAGESSPFQRYDNNLTLGYYNVIYGDGDSTGGIDIHAEALLDMGLWLSAGAGYVLYYNRTSSVLNKVTGASLAINAGYAFLTLENRLNLIPYVRMQHIGQSLSTGYDSSQVDYTDAYGPGLITEYDAIRDTLKFRFDTNVLFSNTKSSFVSPNNYPDQSNTNTLWSFSPSIQYNITKVLTTQFIYSYTINTYNPSMSANTFDFRIGIIY